MEPLDEPFRFSDVVDYFYSTDLPQALTISATLLLLLVILPTIVGTILNRIENHKLGERIPGPDSRGRWGRKSHKKAFMAGGGSVGDPTPFLSALHHEYGLLARFWIGKHLWVSVANPVYATAILETVPGSFAAVDTSLKSVLNSEAMQMKQADDGKHLRLVLRKLFAGEVGASNPYPIVAEAADEGVRPVTDSWRAAVEGGKEWSVNRHQEVFHEAHVNIKSAVVKCLY